MLRKKSVMFYEQILEELNQHLGTYSYVTSYLAHEWHLKHTNSLLVALCSLGLKRKKTDTMIQKVADANRIFKTKYICSRVP